jgi:hypothetical protein
VTTDALAVVDQEAEVHGCDRTPAENRDDRASEEDIVETLPSLTRFAEAGVRASRIFAAQEKMTAGVVSTGGPRKV